MKSTFLKNCINIDVKTLVDGLNYSEKVERALHLIHEAVKEFGDSVVAANSLGKDSVVVWDLVKKVNPKIRGFIVTTRFKPIETKQFMAESVRSYPELVIYESHEEIEPELYLKDPDACCFNLKVIPTREAIREMGAACWITGLRCTEGRTRTDFLEVEERDQGLIKLNPILTWKEREVWQYLALNNVKVNPLYNQGYRSLGCLPCSKVTHEEDERAGRWQGTSKCGGECGIHSQPLN